MLANSHHPEMKKQKIKEQAFSQRNILKIIFFHYKKFPYVSVLFEDFLAYRLQFSLQFSLRLTIASFTVLIVRPKPLQNQQITVDALTSRFLQNQYGTVHY